MYKIGDLVLYSSTGVCRITDIAARNFSGKDKDQLYYILKPLYQDCVISTPVGQQKVFMRPIITKADALALIDTIPTIQAEAYHNRVLRELTEHYEAYLKGHDCAALLELTMSIYAKKKQAEAENRKFGAVDERFMKRAEDLLFGELAAALEISRENVLDFISARIAAAQA